MEFDDKYKLIEKTVKLYADKYGVFTAEDLVNEAWSRRQVREAEEEAHVVKATKDACVDFLRRWYKTGAARNKREIKITPISVLAEDRCFDAGEYKQDSTTDILKADLYKWMSEEERKIVEYRLQRCTYKEIAGKMRKKRSTVYMMHRRIQDRMCKMKEKLLGD